jgi:hypothetical protein
MAKKKSVSLLKWLSGTTAADHRLYKAYADADRVTHQWYLSDKRLEKLTEKAEKFREAHPKVCTGVFIKHKKLELPYKPTVFPLYMVFLPLVRLILLIVCYAVAIAVLFLLIHFL